MSKLLAKMPLLLRVLDNIALLDMLLAFFQAVTGVPTCRAGGRGGVGEGTVCVGGGWGRERWAYPATTSYSIRDGMSNTTSKVFLDQPASTCHAGGEGG